MKLLTPLLALSLLANAGLLWLRSKPSPRTDLPAVPQAASDAAAPGADIRPNPRTSRGRVRETSKPPPTPVATTNAFNWSQLATNDLRQLIRQLRAVGCPEETLQDIALAELEFLSVGRQRALNPSKPYWQADERRGWAKQQRANLSWAKECTALLVEIFGHDFRKQGMAAEDGGLDWTDERVSSVPKEKRDAVRELIEEHSIQSSERHERNRGLWDAQTRAEERASEQELLRKLGQILTPAELERWQLEHSQTAFQMRHDLDGLTLNEAEYKAIFALRERYGDKIHNYGDLDAAQHKAMEESLKQMKADLRASLGDARAKEVERHEDWSFRQLQRLTERNELPADTAVKVYDFKEAAEASAAKLRADQSLPPPQRDAALKAIREEAEKTVKAAMGDAGFKAYERNGGYWINNLSPVTRSKPSP